MAHTWQEAVDAAKASSTRTDSLIAAFASTKARVEELLAQQGQIPPAVQAGLDEIFDLETADAAKMDVALNTNVPPPDMPPVDPNAPTPDVTPVESRRNR